jgi:PBP1b-binding outer membrane lipoprotein LpoB
MKMKKKLISVFLVSTLLVGCGSTKPATDECCKEETAIEKVTTKDPLMKLLVSGLIILSVNFLFTK